VRPRRLIGASGRPLNFTVRHRLVMANPRSIAAAAIAPLLLAVLMSARGCSMGYSGPPLLLWIVFCLTFIYIFFWLCLLITALICDRLRVTALPTSVLINGSVAFALAWVFMGLIGTFARMPGFHWTLVGRDALMVGVACGVSYLIYRLLRRPPGGAGAPAPNNRSRGP
jgi:hypothetical protein